MVGKAACQNTNQSCQITLPYGAQPRAHAFYCQLKGMPGKNGKHQHKNNQPVPSEFCQNIKHQVMAVVHNYIGVVQIKIVFRVNILKPVPAYAVRVFFYDKKRAFKVGKPQRHGGILRAENRHQPVPYRTVHKIYAACRTNCQRNEPFAPEKQKVKNHGAGAGHPVAARKSINKAYAKHCCQHQ